MMGHYDRGPGHYDNVRKAYHAQGGIQSNAEPGQNAPMTSTLEEGQDTAVSSLVNFPQALQSLLDDETGNAVIQRKGWNGVGLIVRLQRPTGLSKMTEPYLYIQYPENHPVYPGAKCPWLASQTDLLSQDWVTFNL